jgi:hypothetical protein
VRGEQVRQAGRAAAPGLGEQRTHELVELVGGAVVGVQRDVDRIAGGDAMDVLRQGDRAERHVLDVLPGGELAAAGAHLQDAVALRLGEGGERGVDRAGRGDVDRRIRELVRPGVFEHAAVRGVVGDGHLAISP